MRPSTTRRSVLQGTTALAVALAGCEHAPGQTPDTTPTTNSPQHTQTTTPAPAASVSITRAAYRAKAWGLPEAYVAAGGLDPVAVSDLPSAARDPIRAAIQTGRYATRDPSNALLDALDGLDLVVLDGTYYDVTHTFPTHAIRLDTQISPDEADADRTVTLSHVFEQSPEAVENVVTKITPHGVQSGAGTYTTTRLDPAVRDFLDRYDYVKYERGVGELVVTHTQRTPPHSIRAEEATDEDLFGETVLDPAEFGPPTERLVQRTVTDTRKSPLAYEDRVHVTLPDDVPQQFARTLDRGSDLVRYDGTVYGFQTRHHHWRDLPLDFTATVPGSGDGTATIELALENTSDDAVELRMHGVAPFGVLWAYGPGGEHVLWTDAYADAEAVAVENDTVKPQGTAVYGRLPPGQTVSETYTLGRDNPVKPGTYEVRGALWPRWPTYDAAEVHDWRSEIFPYALTVEVP